jgi:predicted transcriptional regulator
MANALDRTERSVWGIIKRLRSQGMVKMRRKGRRHHYSIKLDAPFLHPTLKGLTLRPMMEDTIARARTEAPELCERILRARKKGAK